MTQDANDTLLEGYKLVSNAAQEALLNDNIKFKDKYPNNINISIEHISNKTEK